MTDRHVLIIDDDPTIAELFADVLREEGYAAACATTMQDALDLCATRTAEAFTLILSAPFAPTPEQLYACLSLLRACTTAPIVICSDNESLYADHRVRGYAGFLRLVLAE